MHGLAGHWLRSGDLFTFHFILWGLRALAFWGILHLHLVLELLTFDFFGSTLRLGKMQWPGWRCVLLLLWCRDEDLALNKTGIPLRIRLGLMILRTLNPKPLNSVIEGLWALQCLALRVQEKCRDRLWSKTL